MREIYVWPVGKARLVSDINKIPTPCEFVGAFDAYQFYKTDLGLFAIDE